MVKKKMSKIEGITKKQGKALELAFNSGVVKNMDNKEYKDYMQLLLTLSMQTVRANHGDKFISEFVGAALSQKVDFIAQQVKCH